MLRNLLLDAFNEPELRDLCYFTLGFYYDDLPGEGRPAKVRELIARVRRHGQFNELLERCRVLRPHVSLPIQEPLSSNESANIVGLSGSLHAKVIHSDGTVEELGELKVGKQ